MLQFPETFRSFCHCCIFDIAVFLTLSWNRKTALCSSAELLLVYMERDKSEKLPNLSSSEHLVLYAWPELFPIRSEWNRWHCFHLSLNTWAHHLTTTVIEPDRSFSKGSSVILKRIPASSLDYLNIQMLACMDYLWSRWRPRRFSDRWKLKP